MLTNTKRKAEISAYGKLVHFKKGRVKNPHLNAGILNYKK